MKIKELRPIKVPPDFYDELEGIINWYFKQKIFLPLMRELLPTKNMKLNNAVDRDVLIEAIMRGKIYYYRGVFKGSFTAQITREMQRLKGVWSAKDSGFRVPQHNIPYPIQNAIFNSQTTFVRLVERLDKKLQQIMPAEFADLIPLQKILEKMVYKFDESVQDTIKSITVSPKITEEQARKFADPYVGEVRASIKGWTEENIASLRVKVQESVLSGERYESLQKHIQDTYSVSQSKAKFLARQETNLMTFSLKQSRYKDAGIRKYRWACVAGSKLSPVRPLHLIHNNKIYSYDNPPIVNKKGERKNPGEDWGCRCVDIPIVEFNDYEESET